MLRGVGKDLLVDKGDIGFRDSGLASPHNLDADEVISSPDTQFEPEEKETAEIIY